MAPTFQRLKVFEAPSSYPFIDPDTGRQFLAPDKASLIKQIVSYRAQNRLDPIEEIDLVLENYWCSLPGNIGKCHTERLERSFFQTVRGGIALVTNVFFGNDAMVSDEEAERRAQICLQCPNNSFPDQKGKFDSWADKLAEASTHGRKVSVNEQLGNCMICSCNLRAKVFKKPPFSFPEDERKALPDFCWAKNL